jgi:tetratricopeptide (TPR) repeat protein
MTQAIITGLQQLSPYIYLITDIFLIILFLIFLLAFFQKNQKESPLVAQAPSWLIGLGIFGTLLGTTIGLSQFNAQTLEQSIPKLFDGLAMAVITGMVGLSLALLLKWSSTPKTQSSRLSHPVTPNEIYQVLKDISNHNVAQKTILSTIVEQNHSYQQNMQKIMKLQQHKSDQLVNLLENLHATLVNESNNSWLAQFHQLRLTLEQINTTNKNHDFSNHETITSIEQSRDALREIATHTQAIPQTMQQLTQLVHGLNDQLEEMALYLETFKTLRQQATEAFPTLEKNFFELTRIMQQEMQHHLEWLETAMETQLDMAEVALEHQLEKVSALQFEPTSSATKNLTNETEPSISKSAPQIELALKSAMEEQQETELNADENLITLIENTENAETEKTENFSTHNSFTSSEFNANERLTDALTDKDWQEQAYQFMDSGEYNKAVICFQRAIEYAPTDFALYYNQACCYALLKDVQSAVIALQQSIDLNQKSLKMAQTDSDFNLIRHDKNFQSLWLE